MIKQLFLTAALLAPGLAYAGNPSADLSGQIVPASGSIACGVGPNYTGSIPTQASTAGFTTCAANYDFTSSQFANASTWLDCYGANPIVLYYLACRPRHILPVVAAYLWTLTEVSKFSIFIHR
jgi:hypothetical protein